VCLKLTASNAIVYEKKRKINLTLLESDTYISVALVTLGIAMDAIDGPGLMNARVSIVSVSAGASMLFLLVQARVTCTFLYYNNEYGIM